MKLVRLKGNNSQMQCVNLFGSWFEKIYFMESTAKICSHTGY